MPKHNDSNAIRIIKKYTNRRLYDTHLSLYVTLNDVKNLVVSNIEFKVIEAKTQQDLTHATLMQIVAEEEMHNNKIFTTESLKQMIGFYGNTSQTMMSRFLEHSIQMFMQQKANIQSPLTSVLGNTSVSMIQNIARKNIETWNNKTADSGDKKNKRQLTQI